MTNLESLPGRLPREFERRKTRGAARTKSRIAEGIYDASDVRKGMLLPRVAHYGGGWLEFYRPDKAADRGRRWDCLDEPMGRA